MRFNFSMPVESVRQPPYGAPMPQPRNRHGGNYLHPQNSGMLPEPLIWTYVVQLTSALRTIHQVSVSKFKSLILGLVA